MNVIDSWQHNNPNTRQYTFTRNTHSLSRLDRIYTNRNLMNRLSDWEVTDTIVPSDHKMVLTRLAPPTLPFIGPGRWTMPLALITDQELLTNIAELGKALQKELEPAMHTNTRPQTIWLEFKKQTVALIKKASKCQLGKMRNKIAAITKDIKDTEQRDDLDANQDQRSNLAILRQELQYLNQKINRNAKAQAQATWFEKGEKINKYWINIHKPRKPRDPIYALSDQTTNKMVTKSSDMAEIACKYHDNLQSKHLKHPTNPTRQSAIKNVLQQVPDTQKLNELESDLHHLISQEQVTQALRVSKNGTATGLDGLPYELWKALHDEHVRLTKKNSPSFDVTKCLTLVYNNIQKFGTNEAGDFAAGWMCPLYKKKDRTKIENYRPITLLNTDYKIMTKALATQLATHACDLLHPDQSGFVPTRSIFDPIRLAETMSSYADYMEENGAIVALDQEKAYDKIDHHYLIETLKTFRLPDLFINTISTLYKHAKTSVIINGVRSTPYLVTRGVRQGDPLSCLLFDLAIEPLAAYIRNTQAIKGYQIPNTDKTVKINLYADDTTVYLSTTDKYTDLENILSTWCEASGAKFNLEKTEIIPIGTKEHRERLIRSRRIHPDDQPLNPGIRIAEDGHPTRILGAWIGNDIEQAQPWSPILDKIKETLDRWTLANPTLDAKRLIIQMVVGGMTQFLTKAQGMPAMITKRLTTILRECLWDGKKTPPGLSLQQLMKPRQEGGINLLNIEARNQAIDLTWLNTYIDRSKKRPLWAFALDAIINCINDTGITEQNDIHTFLTTLRPSGRQKKNGKQIPRPLITLLQTAKKHNLTFAPRKLSKALKRQMPAWFHIGVPPKLYHKNKTECLRTRHRAIYVKDLLKICKRLNNVNSKHTPYPECRCKDCRQDRTRGCPNPHKCAQHAKSITGLSDELYNVYDHSKKDGLTLTHRRKEKNQKATIENGEEIIFDPTITARGSLDECFRVLQKNKQTTIIEPSYRIRNPHREQGQAIDPVHIYTDGCCLRNGKLDATCGSGVWFSENSPLNRAIKVPGTEHSNQIGEIAAIVTALQITDPTTPILIITDSRYAINGLTKHLQTWENQGWNNISNAEWFQAAAYQLRRRAAPTSFKWTKGHNGDAGNEQADALAKQGANKEQPDIINLDVPENFSLPRMKLMTLTQHAAYTTLQAQKLAPYTRHTLMNLDITRYAIQELTGHLETDASIWNNIRHPDIRRPIQNFLFKAMSGALRIGDFWSTIPNYEHRATCTHCPDTLESLNHILTECTYPTARTIWNLVKQKWPDSENNWQDIHHGHILGCGNIQPNIIEDAGENAAKKSGAARLKRILISESAYLIWALRCERAIGGRTHQQSTVTNRWLNQIITRLNIDRRLAISSKKPNTVTKVKHTWTPILDHPNTLPSNWTTKLEVLVGITLSRPPEVTGETR
jgi:ribonuclease HI